MRLAIIGAGAIGSTIGGHLARAGHDVILICRGAHLAAIRSKGLTLVDGGTNESFTTHPAATDKPEEVGRVDGVILGAKAYSLAELAPRFAGMLGPDTPVVSTQNGVQWWYLGGAPGPGGNQAFETTDPGGVMWKIVGPARAVGGAAMMPCIIKEPGVVSFASGPKMAIGGPDGNHAAFCTELAAALTAGGIETAAGDGRKIMWTKLRGYIGTGPLCTITQTSPAVMRSIPGMPEMQARLNSEIDAVAKAWGVTLPPAAGAPPRPTNAGSSGMPSMWQDFEAGKPLEVDAIVAAPIELGRMRGVDMPVADSVLALLRTRLEWRERQKKA